MKRWKKTVSVFNKIHFALKSGAYYFFDFLNEVELRKNLDIKNNVTEKNNLSVEVTRLIEKNRVIKDIIISSHNEENSYQESVQLISKQTFDDYFNQLGFETISIFGDYKGNPFDQQKSKRLIYLLRKI